MNVYVKTKILQLNALQANKILPKNNVVEMKFVLPIFDIVQCAYNHSMGVFRYASFRSKDG